MRTDVDMGAVVLIILLLLFFILIMRIQAIEVTPYHGGWILCA